MAKYEKTFTATIGSTAKFTSLALVNTYADALIEVFGGEKSEDLLPDETSQSKLSIDLIGFEEYGLKLYVYCSSSGWWSSNSDITLYSFISFEGSEYARYITKLNANSIVNNGLGMYEATYSIVILKNDEGFIILDKTRSKASSTYDSRTVIQCAMVKLDECWAVGDTYLQLQGLGDISDFYGRVPHIGYSAMQGQNTNKDKAIVYHMIPWTGTTEYCLYDKVIKNIVSVKYDKQFEYLGEYKIGEDMYIVFDMNDGSTYYSNNGCLMYKI